MFKLKEKSLAILLITLLFLLFVFVFKILFFGNSNYQNQDNFTLKCGSSGDEFSPNKETDMIWFSVDQKDIKMGDNYELKVYINTENKNLGAFAFDLHFDIENYIVDIESGNSGVKKGVDAKSFTVMSNPNDVSDGHFRFSGICAQNCANGDAEHIATVYLKILNNNNLPDKLDWLEVKELSNELGIGFPVEEYRGAVMVK